MLSYQIKRQCYCIIVVFCQMHLSRLTDELSEASQTDILGNYLLLCELREIDIFVQSSFSRRNPTFHEPDFILTGSPFDSKMHRAWEKRLPFNPDPVVR